MESKRTFEKTGFGMESDIYTSKRGDKESKVVVKDFKGQFQAGFNREVKERLETRYLQLRRQYGEFILLQHAVPTKSDPERFVLAQQRVELSKYPNIFAYNASDLSYRTREQLERLTELVKESYRAFLGYDLRAGEMTDPARKIKPDENAPLDLFGRNNLVVTKVDDIRYIDTGLGLGNYEYLMQNQHELMQCWVARIASLECVLGRSPAEFLQEPMYCEFAEYCSRSENIVKLRNICNQQNPNKAKSIFLSIRSYVQKKEIEHMVI